MQVGSEVVGAIGSGFVMLVAVVHTDTEEDVRALVDKVVHLRVFNDDEGKMNRSLLDVAGSVLVVSQFTLAGEVRKGRRPSFSSAAEPEYAASVVDEIVRSFDSWGVSVATGRFGAMMSVQLVNDGPVTFVIDVEGGSVLASGR